MNAPSAAAALDQAFGNCAIDLVNWVAAILYALKPGDLQ